MLATDDAITADELEAMWGDRPTWRVVPVFALGEADVAASTSLLAQLMADDDLHFTVDGRDQGVTRLRRMAVLDARCADFSVAADLLASNDVSARLVLGWQLR